MSFRVKLKLEYVPSLYTKNRAHTLRRAPGTRMGVAVGSSREADGVKTYVASVVRLWKSETGTVVHSAKVGLGIHVLKSTWQADAINVLDILADGIKLGLGVDDHWFWVEYLDFFLVPKGCEQIELELSQEEDEDHWWCSVCRFYEPAASLDSKKRCPFCRGKSGRRPTNGSSGGTATD